MADTTSQPVDRQLQVYENWGKKQRKAIRALISDSLIEEHRAKARGRHDHGPHL